MKLSKFSLVLLLVASLHQTSDAKNFPIYAHKDLNEQFDDFMSWKQVNKLRNIGIFTAIIGTIIGLAYIGDTYVTDNKNLVDATYPYAQQWFDGICLKYPQADIEQNKFVKSQADRSRPFHNIYFTHASLQQINAIYQKQVDNQTLTEQEKQTLAKEEFLLLYQAGYVKNHNAIKSNIGSMASYIALSYLTIPLLKTFHPQIAIHTFEGFRYEADYFDSDHNILSVVAFFSALAIYGGFSLYYSSDADLFACHTIDDETLSAAAVAFEQEQVTGNRLNNLKNEIARRQQN